MNRASETAALAATLSEVIAIYPPQTRVAALAAMLASAIAEGTRSKADARAVLASATAALNGAMDRLCAEKPDV